MMAARTTSGCSHESIEQATLKEPVSLLCITRQSQTCSPTSAKEQPLSSPVLVPPYTDRRLLYDRDTCAVVLQCFLLNEQPGKTQGLIGFLLPLLVQYQPKISYHQCNFILKDLNLKLHRDII